MQLILGHVHADLDCLASVLCAMRLYPGAVGCLPGSPEPNVRRFIDEHPGLPPLVREKRVKMDEVELLVLVDNRSPSRLSRFEALAGGGVPMHVWDHHPPAPGDLSGSPARLDEVGATVTMLVEEMRLRGLTLTPEEATAALAGLYEDTGRLTYRATTERDREVERFALSCGGSPEEAMEYLELPLEPEQLALLADLMARYERHHFGGDLVVVALAEREGYVPDAAALAHKMRDADALAGLFILVLMGDRVQLIARSTSARLDVGAVAAALGGGGHATAASAAIRELSLEDVRQKVLSLVRAQLNAAEAVEESPPKATRGVARLLEERFPPDVVSTLRCAGRLAGSMGFEAYVVGGLPRDLLLGVAQYDLDVVVEGDGIAFGEAFAKEISGSFKAHRRFGTGIVGLPGGGHIDVASARVEYYERPGVLPAVTRGSIRSDAFRRDFTVNALAVALAPERFGLLLDYVGGLEDLERKVVRAIHDLSFIEDPTRVIRAVRLETRLGFRMDERTESLVRSACRMELFAKVAPPRVWAELVRLFDSPRFAAAVDRMGELGELKFIHPTLVTFPELSALLARCEACLDDYASRYRPARRWLVALAGLSTPLSDDELAALGKRFPVGARELSVLRRARSTADALESGSAPRDAWGWYELLSPLAPEGLAYLLARSPSAALENAVDSYERVWRQERTLLSGEEVLKMGVPAGPKLTELLTALLRARLEGKVRTREEEEALLRELLRR